MFNLATRFWADVRFVFRNSANLFRASPRVKATHRWSRTNGLRFAVFQRTHSSYGFSASSHSQNSLIRHNWTSRRRWPVSHNATLHDRSWEDEAFQDTILSRSQRQGFQVPIEERGVSVHDETLRAASPLRSSAPGCPAPRFDWRRRAASRSPSQGHGYKISCCGKNMQTHIKRLVPQQLEIQPGERFYHEVEAYGDRWVILSCLRLLQSFSLPDFYPCWSSNRPKRKRKCAKDWQNGPSKDSATRVIASPGCQRFG